MAVCTKLFVGPQTAILATRTIIPHHEKIVRPESPEGRFSIPGGASCSFEVVFKPSQAVQASGSVVVTSSNAPPVTVSLLGAGTGAKTLTFDPEEIDFSGVPLNDTSLEQTITLTSTGFEAVTVTSIAVTSGAAEFTLTHNCSTLSPAGSAVNDNNTCTVTVKFKPLQVGARSGEITVTSDADGSPHMLRLFGEGLALDVPVLFASASALGFGQQGYGYLSLPQMVTLTNPGLKPVIIAAIYTTGDFVRSHTCPPALAADQSCIVTINFIPSLQGDRSGELFVESNAYASPLRLPLQGTGCRFFSIGGSRLPHSLCGH